MGGISITDAACRHRLDPSKIKPLPTNNPSFLERETGIEPASLAWKARVLPLNYSRPGASQNHFHNRVYTTTLQLVEEAGFEPA
jgi:hypothetical protein